MTTFMDLRNRIIPDALGAISDPTFQGHDARAADSLGAAVKRSPVLPPKQGM